MTFGKPEGSINSLLEGAITHADFPSAVYLVYSNGSISFADALGNSVIEPEVRAAVVETIYDLASLTKPLVTGLTTAILIERGEIELDDRIGRWIPEFAFIDKEGITIRHLLTHTSGLPAWRPLYITTGGDPQQALRAIASEPLESAPGTHVIYSDLGFIVLGYVIEGIMNRDLKSVAETEIFAALGLKRSFFKPDASLRREIAASELGNGYEAAMCQDRGIKGFDGSRKDVIWGEVHDGNAYFLGGAAGHAGLFSTVGDVMQIARQFIPSRTELLSPDTCSLFRTNLTVGLKEARSFAWQLAQTRDSTAGPSLAPDSFGHTGFTGTSCWVDAAFDRVFVLLTNRTHARGLPFANINGIRRKFHTLAMAALGNE